MKTDEEIERIEGLLKKGKSYVVSVYFPRDFVEFTGSKNAAMLLARIMYWAKRTIYKDGGFYKTDNAWDKELSLSRKELENAKSLLSVLNLYTVEKHRAEGHFTNHYYFDWDAFEVAYTAFLGKLAKDSPYKIEPSPYAEIELQRSRVGLPYED